MPYADPKKNLACKLRWQKAHPENFKRYYEGHKKLHQFRCERWLKKNKSRYQALRKKHRARKDIKRAERGYRLKALYGITVEQFEHMFKKQKGRCPLCSRRFSKTLRPHIDHEHASGRFRGLLCATDNICLASLDRDRTWGRKALKYIGRK